MTDKRFKITKDVLLSARDRMQELKEIQNNAREEEIKIRTFLADKLHDGEEGSKTLTIDGVKVNVTRPISRIISREEADRLCKDHTDLSAEALRWKPEVVVSVVKAHPELEEYITSKPGLVTVEFK